MDRVENGRFRGEWALSCEVQDGGFSREAYLASALYMLGRTLPADTTTWNAVNLTTGWTEVYGTTAGAQWGEDAAKALGKVVADHPMVTSYFDPATRRGAQPRRMSDVASAVQLHRTRAYNELLHPFGAEHQLTIVSALAGPTAATRPDMGRCWTFNRAGRDFTEEEREVARLLQPVLVALDQACRDPSLGVGAGLAAVSPIEDAERLGVTARELQVLGLLGRGLTAAAIARALGVSRGTVRKHLENVYRKLDAHDRLMAVTRARSLGLIASE